jgi:transcriptional regulator with XRE-family HTH domain
MTIGELIKYERIRNHLSQEDVARAIGSTKQAVYKYENGIVTNIPMDKVEVMASLFGVTPAYLMGWENKIGDSVSVKNFDIQLFSEKATTPTEPKLSEGEKLWLQLYNSVSEDTRNILIGMMFSLDKLPNEFKEEAINRVRDDLKSLE